MLAKKPNNFNYFAKASQLVTKKNKSSFNLEAYAIR